MTTPDPDATHRVADAVSTSPRAESNDAQFAPGTLVAGRYRIATLLGRGGMGEVYRADDVKLGQTVALKFVPARLARDPLLLARLHDEVRLGRQITHPNVCRIHDIGETEGAHFVAMEYVDGEDLARLLHRIGRLAHDKAVEIARGIAAGVNAAHAKGILHRDLKPANVMIDSHGAARITDFGLALSSTADQRGEISGTPAYMAPEQLHGTPATVQSDLYSLGLLMYELFTGRRAHAARTFPDRLRDATSEITSPSSHVTDLDPAVERIILRCLAADPAARPRSAREVIDSLPGGDPLAAAIAAGETPSPRIVAAAGSAGVLSRRAAWSILAMLALCLGVVFAGWTVRSETMGGALLPPEVLRDRAIAMLNSFSLDHRGTPIAAFHYDPNYLAWRYKHGNWGSLNAGPPWLRYRLEYGPTARQSVVNPFGAAAPGWTTIEVDNRGRLAYILAAPERDWTPSRVAWTDIFSAAGLDPARLTPSQPQFIPPAPFDELRAWAGTYPGDRLPVRVEAALWRGRPVYFRVTGEWDDIDATKGVPFANRSLATPLTLFLSAVILAGLLLAWYNLRARRGDRRGGFRAAGIVFTLTLLGLLLSEPVGRGPSALDRVVDVTGQALFQGALVFFLYIALEPYVRRRWPSLLIGWSRFIGGNWRDPMVGRDLLVGMLAGSIHAGIAISTDAARAVLRGIAAEPSTGDPRRLLGPVSALGDVLVTYAGAFAQALIFVTVLVLLAMLLRKKGYAVAAFAVLMFILYGFATQGDLLLLAVATGIVGVLTVTMVRFGLLALTVAQGTFLALLGVPTAMGASWTIPIMLLPVAAIAILATWAFRRALGDQSPFPALPE